MRCSCQKCGTYMVQDEKGILSRCICPECFETCSACLGTEQKPLSPKDLEELCRRREAYDDALVQNEETER